MRRRRGRGRRPAAVPSATLAIRYPHGCAMSCPLLFLPGGTSPCPCSVVAAFSLHRPLKGAGRRERAAGLSGCLSPPIASAAATQPLPPSQPLPLPLLPRLLPRPAPSASRCLAPPPPSCPTPAPPPPPAVASPRNRPAAPPRPLPSRSCCLGPPPPSCPAPAPSLPQLFGPSPCSVAALLFIAVRLLSVCSSGMQDLMRQIRGISGRDQGMNGQGSVRF